jgi:hypothetical protein
LGILANFDRYVLFLPLPLPKYESLSSPFIPSTRASIASTPTTTGYVRSKVCSIEGLWKLSTGVRGGVSTVDVPENRKGGTRAEDFQPDFFDGPLRERVRVCGFGVISPLAISVALSSVESNVGNRKARPIDDFDPIPSSPSKSMFSVSESLSLIGGGGEVVRLYRRPFVCEGVLGLDEGRFGYRSKYLGVEESGEVCEGGV